MGKGILWSLLERAGHQTITLIVTLIMARRLGPQAYGLIAMTAIFIEVASALAEGGVTQALIRNGADNVSKRGAALVLNISLSLILVATIWIIAPHISHFYNLPPLTSISRALAMVIPLQALSAVPRAAIGRKIDFRRLALASIPATLLSGALGIAMAFLDYGVWAIVAYQISTATFTTILIWMLAGKSISLNNFIPNLREIFSFGTKISIAGILDSGFKNLYPFVIGKVCGAGLLGNFSKARQLASFPAIAPSSVVQRVAYPRLCVVLSESGDASETFLGLIRNLQGIVLLPMCLIISLAPQIVEALLGNAWAGAAPLLRILSLSLAFYPMQMLNLQLIQAAGNASLFLRLEIYKKVVAATTLAIGCFWGINGICWSMVVSSIFALIINSSHSAKSGGATLPSQLKVLILPAVLAAFAGSFAWMAYSFCSIIFTISSATLLWIKLILSLIAGIGFWLLAAIRLHLVNIHEIRGIWIRK